MDPRAFLDRFSRAPEPPPELTAALGDLGRLGADRPDLAGPSAGLAAALKAAFSVAEPPPEGPDLDCIARGWAEGTPAFRAAPPRLDGPSLIARARSIAGAIEGPSARSLREAIRRGRVDLPGLALAVLAGRAGAVESAGEDPATLGAVLRLALLPALAARSALLDRARPEGAWGRGDCPGCGGPPLLAESRGLEQRIAYRCGLCAADWAGERLGCPACGESDSKRLRYAFVEGEQDRYRLASCQSCGVHWKVVSTLAPLTAPGLLVAELATFHLEVLAED